MIAALKQNQQERATKLDFLTFERQNKETNKKKAQSQIPLWSCLALDLVLLHFL